MITYTMEEQLVIKSLSDFVENEVKLYVPEIEKTNTIPKALWDRVVELGFAGVSFPEKYGGMGMRGLMDKVVLEEIAKESPALALAIDAHHLATRWIMMFGSKAQKEEYLPKMVYGEMIGASASTDPAGCGVFAETQPIGVPGPDGFILNGTKLFCTNASFADVIALSGIIGENYCSVLVDPKSEGVQIIVDHKLGMHGSGTATIRLNNVVVPYENVIAPDEEMDPELAFLFTACYLDISAIALGCAESAYKKTLEYLKGRMRNGKPLASFQVIARHLAKMKGKIEMMRAMVYSAADSCDHRPDPLIVHATKAMVTEMACEVTEMAIKLYGGAGYMEDTGVARFHRDAICCTIGENPTDVHLDQVALQLGLPIETSTAMFPIIGDYNA